MSEARSDIPAHRGGALGPDEAAEPNAYRLREQDILGSLSRRRRELEEGAAAAARGGAAVAGSAAWPAVRRVAEALRPGAYASSGGTAAPAAGKPGSVKLRGIPPAKE